MDVTLGVQLVTSSPELNLFGAERERHGRRWLAAGLGEHASVAAFAYLILDLLRLGAPPQLVLAASRALEDEIEHARICFVVARDLNGTAASPGPLALPECRRPREAGAILEAAVIEGCIEEVISAECARVACERAEDPHVRKVMARISQDEARHAELSWRIVEWMLERQPELRATANAAFARGVEVNDKRGGAEDEADMPETYGCLRGETRRRVRQQTIDQIIGPRARQLLG